MNQTEEISEPEAIEALSDCVQQVWNNASAFTGKEQSSVSKDLFYYGTNEYKWTGGFFKGELWLAYQMTHDSIYKTVAEHQIIKMLHHIESKSAEKNYFYGLIYNPSCVSAYRNTTDEDAEEAALLAATELLFSEEDLLSKNALKDGRILFNIPLLMWAAKITIDDRFTELAQKICTEATKVISEVTENPEQYGDASQSEIAWRIYGLAIAAKYFPVDEHLVLFRYLTERYFTLAESGEFTDAASAAVVCCGLQEIVLHLRASDGIEFANEINFLTHKALVLLKNLVYDFAVQSPKTSNGLLFTILDDGSEECTSWGDYFYMEALVRYIKPNWRSCW